MNGGSSNENGKAGDWRSIKPSLGLLAAIAVLAVSAIQLHVYRDDRARAIAKRIVDSRVAPLEEDIERLKRDVERLYEHADTRNKEIKELLSSITERLDRWERQDGRTR